MPLHLRNMFNWMEFLSVFVIALAFVGDALAMHFKEDELLWAFGVLLHISNTTPTCFNHSSSFSTITGIVACMMFQKNGQIKCRMFHVVQVQHSLSQPMQHRYNTALAKLYGTATITHPAGDGWPMWIGPLSS